MDYKKILEGVVNIINTTEKSDIGFANICTYICENCPELSESEDERIRKNLIGYIKGISKNEVCEETKDSWIAWLEKQGVQKSANKVESNKKFTPIESALKDLICDVDNSYTIEQVRRFLFEYGYKDKILNAAQEEMQKPAWSEEDENYLNTTIAYLKDAKEFKKTAENCINWLKSLRPQNTWKPTTEQLTELRCVISGCSFETSILVELEEDLKKLL